MPKSYIEELVEIFIDCKKVRIFQDFCVFKYARTVKQNVWSEIENRERDS